MFRYPKLIKSGFDFGTVIDGSKIIIRDSSTLSNYSTKHFKILFRNLIPVNSIKKNQDRKKIRVLLEAQ